VTGFTTPGEIYRYDIKTGVSTLTERVKVAFDPDNYEVSQVFYSSKDGTKVPMFLVHRKGLVRDGSNPVILTGYGGFDISLTPMFSPSIIAWMDLGGVFAEANLRGGSEYGQAWHDAGRRLKKQNVFDDFIAAAEWMIAEKYTVSSKLAISGGSNGGLLVAACLNQRPELFGAALPAVGVHDLLRFHKFTIGWAWQDEYGSPDDPIAFANLRKLSPIHNVKAMSYPPTMILTGDHDDRVFPAHSFKYAATLQEMQTGPAPILLRVDLKAGHGAGKPTAKQIDETADKYAFLVQSLGMKLPEK
jgi:prolyl oligopeptidase